MGSRSDRLGAKEKTPTKERKRMTRISDVIERANDELQETLSKAEEEDDLSTLAEIYDEIGHKADKYANIFSTATKSLNGESDTDEVANEVEEQMDEEADGEEPKAAKKPTGSKSK